MITIRETDDEIGRRVTRDLSDLLGTMPERLVGRVCLLVHYDDWIPFCRYVRTWNMNQPGEPLLEADLAGITRFQLFGIEVRKQ